MRAGKQRYKCKDCGACFTDGALYSKAKKLPPLEMTCPKCGGERVYRDGKLADGSQRYRCLSCDSRFSSKTKLPTIKWECPYCGGKLRYSGYSRKGNHDYKCSKCGKSCVADNEGKPIKREPFFSQINTTIECPACKSLNIRKAGKSKTNQNRYICKDCGRGFVMNDNIKNIVNDILAGHNMKKVSLKYNYPLKSISELMKAHYKTEKITLEQRKMIIKYGYYLRVPVDYMAEYVKCSEHKCQEVLRKFNKKIMSTNHDAT
jgi:transposase-like protein